MENPYQFTNDLGSDLILYAYVQAKGTGWQSSSLPETKENLKTFGESPEIPTSTYNSLSSVLPLNTLNNPYSSNIGDSKFDYSSFSFISTFFDNIDTITDPREKKERLIVPGSEDYIKAAIGENLYGKLSKKNREFLKVASSLWNLGPQVDIERILRTLREDLR